MRNLATLNFYDMQYLYTLGDHFAPRESLSLRATSLTYVICTMVYFQYAHSPPSFPGFIVKRRGSK